MSNGEESLIPFPDAVVLRPDDSLANDPRYSRSGDAVISTHFGPTPVHELFHDRRKRRPCDAHLPIAVAVANRDFLIGGRLFVADGLHVHGHAKRRADLVLATVETADGRRVVVDRVPALAQVGASLFAVSTMRDVLLEQRQHRDLDRRQFGMKVQHHALFAFDLFFLICVDQKCQRAVDPRPADGSMT